MNLMEFIVKYPDLTSYLVNGIFVTTGALVSLTGYMLKRSVDRLTSTIDKMQVNETLMGNRITAIEAVCKLRNHQCFLNLIEDTTNDTLS